MGTEIPGIQLHESPATEAAPCAESDGSVQGASSGTHKPDTGHKPRPNGPGLSGISPRMDRLLRTMPNTGSARQAGEMAPTPTSVDGLEAVETRNHEISGAPQARHRCAGRRENGGTLFLHRLKPTGINAQRLQDCRRDLRRGHRSLHN